MAVKLQYIRLVDGTAIPLEIPVDYLPDEEELLIHVLQPWRNEALLKWLESQGMQLPY